MATENYTRTARTEAEIDTMMENKGTRGYSELYYTNKRSFNTEEGKTAWAVDVEKYYG